MLSAKEEAELRSLMQKQEQTARMNRYGCLGVIAVAILIFLVEVFRF